MAQPYFTNQPVPIQQVSPELLMAPGRAMGRAFEKLGQSVGAAMERKYKKEQEEEARLGRQTMLARLLPESSEEELKYLSKDKGSIDALTKVMEIEQKQSQQQMMADYYRAQSERLDAAEKLDEAKIIGLQAERDNTNKATQAMADFFSRSQEPKSELRDFSLMGKEAPSTKITAESLLKKAQETGKTASAMEYEQAVRNEVGDTQKDLLSFMTKRGVDVSKKNIQDFIESSGLPKELKPKEVAELAKSRQSIDKASLGANLESRDLEVFKKAKLIGIQLKKLNSAYKDAVKSGSKTGRIGGAISQMKGWAGLDSKAARIAALKTSMVADLARGVFGEVGVLTDKDFARYADLLPTLNRPEEIAEIIFKDLEETLYYSTQGSLDILKAGTRNIGELREIFPKNPELEKKLKAKTDEEIQSQLKSTEDKIAESQTAKSNKRYRIIRQKQQ
jgi:6-pyruvoyl-tetrahydropterin synthase